MFGYSRRPRQSKVRKIFGLGAAVFFGCLAPAFCADETMVFAVDVIRHGDRTPIIELPNVPVKWPQGLGQLTAEGMNQEFQLGKEFRKRYVEQYHLLPETYDRETMYVRASDVDRTLMSAECTLLGLYPMGKGPLTESGTEAVTGRYQPIPVHTRPRDTDDVLIPDANKALPEVSKRFVYESADWKAKFDQEQPNFERWGKLIGKPITAMQQLSLIGDAFYIMKLHHVPLPKGITQADADAMAKLGDWVFAENFKPAEVGQVTGINLLKLIVNHFEEATRDSSKLKYELYSAHDSTICALLSAVKAPADTKPHYSSDLNITLWKTDGKFNVKMTLNGQPVNFPGSVNGTGSLEKFAELLPRKTASSGSN